MRRLLCLVAVLVGTFMLGLMPPATAFELTVIGEVQQREDATRELASARQRVRAAQVEAHAARHALDQFLASHFESRMQVAAARKSAASTKESATDDAELAELESQVAKLRTEREQLLATLTEAHPEVIDVTERIEALESRIQEHESAAADSNSVDPDAAGRHAQQTEEDAKEYQQLQDRWQEAERVLESARAAESAAADRLAVLTKLEMVAKVSPAAPVEVAKPAAKPAPQAPLANHTADDTQADPHPAEVAAAPISPAEVASDDDAGDSASRTQSLALASLALAVMLAALAAVRMAKATSDPLFASADEIAAALAVPVMGIVPFSARRSSFMLGGVRPLLWLLAQVALAICLFVGVAYAVAYFDAVVRFISDPIPAIRAFLGI